MAANRSAERLEQKSQYVANQRTQMKAGMHGCGDEWFVVLAIAIKRGGEGDKLAVHLHVWRAAAELQMVFINAADSPWAAHSYLGSMLAPDEARQHALRGHFIHLAVHVLRENPVVSEYIR
jgi:hypothetical protein